MAARRADLADLPYWPRMLSREQAAAYVGVSAGTFEKEVADGVWPGGERRGARVLWDRALLDRTQDERSGLLAQSAGLPVPEGREWDGWK